MSEVLSLDAARVERSARERARIEALFDASTTYVMARIEWLLSPAQLRGEVADSLLAEIAVRYRPIAEQFKAALFDALVLAMAGAQERGEDHGQAIIRGLAVTMNDMRYVELAKHITRESLIATNPQVLNSLRVSDPSPVDKACADLFETYLEMRKTP